MIAATVKLVPLLLAWGGLVAALERRFPRWTFSMAMDCAIGFCGGIAAVTALLALHKVDLSYGLIKSVTGGAFVLLWGVAAAALYAATGRRRKSDLSMSGRFIHLAVHGAVLTCAAVAGAICAIRLTPQSGATSFFSLALLGLAGVFVTAAATFLERRLPAVVTVTNETLLLLVTSLLMFMSAFVLRLDLFSPLTMNVMKFIHDFVHHSFESLLIPDHPFFRPDVWSYIGYLFSSSVGLWGGMIVWFVPSMLIIYAIHRAPLPSVVHIRQGAQRRKLLAASISDRRCQLIVPWLAVLILAAAVDKSRFPSIEYWDPQPVIVARNPSGNIVVPKKGEIDLADGKLHKYLFKEGGREARFILLTTPAGKLTATLDACAICKPQGYGQAEGSVVCYYCKTLIPLDTVGKPGGCNPVPIPFEDQSERVVIESSTLLNIWTQTVSTTDRNSGDGK